MKYIVKVAEEWHQEYIVDANSPEEAEILVTADLEGEELGKPTFIRSIERDPVEVREANVEDLQRYEN